MRRSINAEFGSVIPIAAAAGVLAVHPIGHLDTTIARPNGRSDPEGFELQLGGDSQDKEFVRY